MHVSYRERDSPSVKPRCKGLSCVRVATRMEAVIRRFDSTLIYSTTYEYGTKAKSTSRGMCQSSCALQRNANRAKTTSASSMKEKIVNYATSSSSSKIITSHIEHSVCEAQHVVQSLYLRRHLRPTVVVTPG